MYATEGTASSALLCLVFGGGDSSAREKAKHFPLCLSMASDKSHYTNNDSHFFLNNFLTYKPAMLLCLKWILSGSEPPGSLTVAIS